VILHLPEEEQNGEKPISEEKQISEEKPVNKEKLANKKGDKLFKNIFMYYLFMEIVEIGQDRILKKSDGTDVNINDGQIIKYIGLHYSNADKIETEFVGKIVCCRWSIAEGFTGIFVEPLYIKNDKEEWQKFKEYTEPETKYFIYPHFLLVPSKYYPNGINYLHTVVSFSLNTI